MPSDVPEGIELREMPDTLIRLFDKSDCHAENILKIFIKFTSAGFIEIGYEYPLTAKTPDLCRIQVRDLLRPRSDIRAFQQLMIAKLIIDPPQNN